MTFIIMDLSNVSKRKKTEQFTPVFVSLDLNNVSTKFQLDWPANNRIIAGSLFSHFSGSLFSDFKMLGNTAVDATATKFLYLEDES